MLNHKEMYHVLMLIRYMNLGEHVVYDNYKYYIKNDGTWWRRSLKCERAYIEHQLLFNLEHLNEIANYLINSKLNIMHFKDAESRFEDIVKYVFEHEDKED